MIAAALRHARQEIVRIGMRMQAEELKAGFDACLLTDAEMALGEAAWRAFDDPFGAWRTLPKPEPRTR